MKKIERIPPPDCLNNDIKKSRNKKIGFYENLKDKQGNVYPRWNTTCKDTNDVSRIRTQLLKMSENTCIFCGERIGDSKMDVDHYLPKSQFPYVAYCWENLLPTCKYCNQTLKKDYIPSALKEKKIVESIISDKFEYDYIYDKQHLLTNIAKDDRLIDPTFDDPEEHLEFNPEFYFYEGKTEIGKITADKLFNRHKEVAEKWEGLSRFIKNIVMIIDDDPLAIVSSLIIDVAGYEHICLEFYEYWRNEKQAGRI